MEHFSGAQSVAVPSRDDITATRGGCHCRCGHDHRNDRGGTQGSFSRSGIASGSDSGCSSHSGDAPASEFERGGSRGRGQSQSFRHGGAEHQHQHQRRNLRHQQLLPEPQGEVFGSDASYFAADVTGGHCHGFQSRSTEIGPGIHFDEQPTVFATADSAGHVSDGSAPEVDEFVHGQSAAVAGSDFVVTVVHQRVLRGRSPAGSSGPGAGGSAA